jgi:phage shock protein E
LYADWCLPCKILSPILDKISADLKTSVTFYKINIDKHPDIATLFQVNGIPLVVLIKEKKVVQAFMGVQPEGAYRRAILANSPPAPGNPKNPADGELVNGVRVITLSTGTNIGNLYVYRGEEVRLIFNKVDFPYSVHIPALKASGSAQKGQNLTLEFKATEAGVFSMMCNGKCPVGDGQQFAKIVVLEYEAEEGKTVFKSISPKAAAEMIAKEKPFLLDVRTPNEYYDAHISGATLMPVQQLAERISELDAVKDKPILVYCRSGNRSIPASQILIRNGFKKIYNLQNGITGWMKDNLPVERL